MNRTGLIVVLGAAALLAAVAGQQAGVVPTLPAVAAGLPAGLLNSVSGASDAANTSVTLGALRIDGRGTSTRTVVGNGGWAVLSAGYGTRYTGEPARPRLSLERRVGSGAWQPTAAPVGRTASGALQVRTPVWSTSSATATATVQYRLVSEAFTDGTGVGVDATTRSTAVTVRYERQSTYTGLAAVVYRAAARFCPSTAVHVRSLSGAEAGRYGTGSQLIEIDAAVGVSTVVRPIDVRAVALHECAHERQWMNYGGTGDGRDVMERAVAARFSEFEKPAGVRTPYVYREPEGGTIEPIEHAADCSAQAVNPGGYLGYGGYCTPGELAAGERLLRGGTY